MNDKKQQTAYPLRMPPELRAQLENLAHTNKRSLNAEILARLEDSVSQQIDDAEPGEDSTDMRFTINKAKLLASLDHAPDEDPGTEEGLRVIKRNGQIINYTDDAITRAIIRAFEAVEGGLYKGDGGGKGPKPRKRYTKE